MCDFATALTIAGTVAGAFGTFQQSQAASATANYNAQIAERNAQIAEAEGAENARRTREAGRRVLGQQQAGFGVSGAVVGEGTPLDVLGSTAADVELDALTARYGANIEAQNARLLAAQQRSRASSARSSGFIGAGTSLLMGAGRIDFDRLRGSSGGSKNASGSR